MSIVGTRPPTLDEWNKYELHHRARLAIYDGKLVVNPEQLRELDTTEMGNICPDFTKRMH